MRQLSQNEILELCGRVLVKAGAAQEIDAPLLAAFCRVESGGFSGAVRHEPGFRYVIEPRTLPAGVRPFECSRATELVLQRCSLGLMQIMGATARDLGFKGWLTELLEPEVGVRWGLEYLLRQHHRFSSLQGLEAVIASYNAGSPRRRPSGEFVNQAYVDRILVLAGRRRPGANPGECPPGVKKKEIKP